jgi:hypothetical protein
MRKVNPTVPESSTQYQESRRVWFAAVCSLYYFMLAGEFQKLSEDEAMHQLSEIGKQLKEFQKLIGFNR